MKKITLLFTMLLTSSLMFSQVVLTEDFEGGLTIPTGWTNNDIAGGGEVWAIATGGEAVGYNSPNTIYYTNGEMGGNYALFDSDSFGGTTVEDAALESPVFDCSTLTSVTLSFNHFFTAGFGGEGFVEVSNDGTNWTLVDSYSGADQAASSFGFESYDVSTELAGSAAAQVRFRWTGDFAWGWAFDNVSVFQCTVSTPDAVTAVSPADGATDVDINFGTTNNLGPIEWAAAATGGAPDSFNISLGATPTGDDIGVIGGFGSGGSINFGWLPNTTYYWFIEAVNCAGTTTSPVFSFTTSACTETTPPGVVNTPVPTDGDTDVSVNVVGNAVTFNWTPTDANANFTLNLDTVNPPVANAFDDFESGDPITGLAVNTTYFWSIDAVNCNGTTPGTVWSFTTAAALSVEENELETFSVYPNPTSDVLNIKTTKTIDNVTVFNLLGQSVANFNGNQIVDDSINLSELSKGLYLVKITAEGTTQTIRVTKE
ncbi:T9SS type A sorting domain-containing protein [uncultured Winogradskyella sp.]|uniref:T9SS type A sorting domain-containing protein n=1 Tax=uncultured Winogradskyella sp. TaxID=395353 RepID=UPI0030DC5059